MSTKSFKLIVIGDSGVGKTSLIKKFTKNKFSPSYLTTIGVEFESKEMVVNEEKIQLQIWDTVSPINHGGFVWTSPRVQSILPEFFDISVFYSFFEICISQIGFFGHAF